MDFSCYAQRILNPFRGIQNTIAFEAAEAVSTDGSRWDIYVRNEDLLDHGERETAEAARIQVSEIRFGTWTREHGLRRASRHTTLDTTDMEYQGEILASQLPLLSERIPFPLQDRYELWLLDTEGLPFALINSCVFEHEIELDQCIHWNTGQYCASSFTSDKLADSCLPPSKLLDLHVVARTGNHPSAQWFRRTVTGEGVGCAGINLEHRYLQRVLPASRFPRFILNDCSSRQVRVPVVTEYLDWLAPWLLLLQDLDRPTRSALEHQARRQAAILAQQHRLYPEIINSEVINVARIQAMLSANDAAQESTDDLIHAFYREVGVNG